MTSESSRPDPTGVATADCFLIVALPGSATESVAGDLERGWPRAFGTETVPSVDAAVERMLASPPTAVVLGLSSLDGSGLDALRALRAARRSVPVIVLTRQDEEDLALRALVEGAQDYVVAGKGDPTGLSRSLRYAVERQATIDSALNRESRYRALLETLAEGIVVRDRDGSIVMANLAAEEITGLNLEQMVDWPPGYRATLEDGTEIDAGRTPGEIVISSGVGIDDVLVNLHFPWGEIKQVLTSIRPVWREDEDEPVASVASLRDVTELRRAQSALAHNEARFRALVQNSADGIVIVDEKAKIVYCNPGMERIFGLPLETYLGRSAFDLMHPDEVEKGVALLADQILRPSDTAVAEFRGRHADGSWRWLEVAAQNRLADPAVSGIVANFRDVTDRKHAENDLKASLSQTAALAELGQHALAGIALSELMGQAVRMTAANLGGRVAILLADADNRDLELMALSAGSERSVGALRIRIDPKRPTGLAFTSREPIVVTDRANDPRFRRRDPLDDDEAVSAAYVVLEGPTQPAGVMTLHSREPRQFSESDMHFMQAVGNVVASALERQSREDDIRHQALHDSLTGLPNRVLFLDRLQQALGRAGRRDRQVAVLFLDLDRFKVINDSLGHSVGDRVLTSVADRLRSAVRPGDTVARLGGDEFSILCEDVGRTEDVVALAQRIALALTGPMGEQGFHVTASVGIALGGRTADAEALVRDADAAMYRAKERGRDRCEVFDEDTRDRAVRRLDLEHELRLALDHGELRIHVQPIVAVADESTVGAEALVRWDHPRLGLIAPSEFVPLAEETGLVGRLGRWVLDQACVEAERWRSQGLGTKPLVISVNLSPRQLAQIGLTDEVASSLERSGLPPELLCLEVTETAVMEDVELSVAVLRRLNNLGVRISIDDFGTGYSSLSYLKRFPVDELKVDRSFIDGLGHEAHDSTIVSAVVGLAHNLGMKAVAEGVETPRQLAELVALGCDLAQGYLWRKPASVDDFASWLRAPDGAA